MTYAVTLNGIIAKRILYARDWNGQRCCPRHKSANAATQDDRPKQRQMDIRQFDTCIKEASGARERYAGDYIWMTNTMVLRTEKWPRLLQIQKIQVKRRRR